jgi:hypothetical protein
MTYELPATREYEKTADQQYVLGVVADAMRDELLAAIAELESENFILTVDHSTFDHAVNRAEQAEARVAELERMHKLAIESRDRYMQANHERAHTVAQLKARIAELEATVIALRGKLDMEQKHYIADFCEVSERVAELEGMVEAAWDDREVEADYRTKSEWLADLRARAQEPSAYHEGEEEA